MHSAIVYVSVHHGNTRAIAEAIAKPLGATLCSLEQVMNLDVAALDLVGFGSGIYFGRHHSSLLQLVRNLPSLPARTFVFSTAGIAMCAGLWHRPLIQQLRRRGSVVVGDFCSPGWDTVGPLKLIGGLHRHRPNEKDLARAAEFGRWLRSGFDGPPSGRTSMRRRRAWCAQSPTLRAL
jgi:flavodoxin